MMRCCDVTYTKYINEDGSIDYQEYYKGLKIASDYYLNWLITEKPNGSKRSQVILHANPDKICRCRCHIKGDEGQVMH